MSFVNTDNFQHPSCREKNKTFLQGVNEERFHVWQRCSSVIFQTLLNLEVHCLERPCQSLPQLKLIARMLWFSSIHSEKEVIFWSMILSQIHRVQSSCVSKWPCHNSGKDFSSEHPRCQIKQFSLKASERWVAKKHNMPCTSWWGSIQLQAGWQWQCQNGWRWQPEWNSGTAWCWNGAWQQQRDEWWKQHSQNKQLQHHQ